MIYVMKYTTNKIGVFKWVKKKHFFEVNKI